MATSLPPVLFVAGKGGVGRSTVAVALGTHFARRGERVLLVQWAVPDALSGWFDRPASNHEAQELRPGLSTMNYSCPETLREYFVGHLGLKRFHRFVIASEPIQRAVNTVPGVPELLFLGRIYWLRALAPAEIGVSWDRLIIDAPATGHGVSLLGVPATVEKLGTGGLLHFELGRVGKMLADPAQVGAIVVTLAEELPIEETHELLAGIEEKLGRPALAAIVNRSVAMLGEGDAWFDEVAAAARPGDRAAIAAVAGELAGRVERERTFRRVHASLPLGTCSIDEGLLIDADPRPRAIAEHAAEQLSAWLAAEDPRAADERAGAAEGPVDPGSLQPAWGVR